MLAYCRVALVVVVLELVVQCFTVQCLMLVYLQQQRNNKPVFYCFLELQLNACLLNLSSLEDMRM